MPALISCPEATRSPGALLPFPHCSIARRAAPSRQPQQPQEAPACIYQQMINCGSAPAANAANPGGCVFGRSPGARPHGPRGAAVAVGPLWAVITPQTNLRRWRSGEISAHIARGCSPHPRDNLRLKSQQRPATNCCKLS